MYYIVEGKKPIIRIRGKTKNGKTILILDKSFRPYFYVEPKGDLEGIKSVLRHGVDGIIPLNVEFLRRNLFGKIKELLKVTLNSPSDVKKIRDYVLQLEGIRNRYEYSISFYRRYIIDRGILPSRWIKVSGQVLDNTSRVDLTIELDEVDNIESSDNMALKTLSFDTELIEEDGDNKIIMISFQDSDGFKKNIVVGSGGFPDSEFVSTEEALIRRFVEIVVEIDPDIICGYNTDKFDFPILLEKAEKYGIKLCIGRDNSSIGFFRRGLSKATKVAGRCNLDLFNFVDTIISRNLSSETNVLEDVASELLNKKIKKIRWEEIEESWKTGEYEKMIDKCNLDAELALKLTKNLIGQITELSRVCGQTLFDVSRFSYSKLVEWLLIRRSYEAGELIPNIPTPEEIRNRRLNKYEGGYVHTPSIGMYENIAVFDFHSLYPSIINLHNISPETLNCNCCNSVGTKELISEYKNKVPDEDYYFCLKHKGFIPQTVDILIRERNSLIKQLDEESNTNLINREHALKILTNAVYGYYAFPGSRWYSIICAKSITAWGRFYIKNVINFVSSENNVIYGDTDSLFVTIKNEKAAKNLLERINDNMNKNLFLGFRGFFGSGIIVSKKKYALLDFNDKLLIRGFEKVRRDWSHIARETQEKIIYSILKNRSVDDSLEYVSEVVTDIKNGKVKLPDLSISTKITRPLENYEHIDPHVSAAIRAVKRGKSIKPGSIVNYIVTKGSGSISDRSEIIEYAKSYDPEYYINNQVIPAAIRVISIFGYTEDDLLSGKQQSLNKFIKESKLRRIRSMLKMKK